MKTTIKDPILPKVERMDFWKAESIASANGKTVADVQDDDRVEQLSEQLATPATLKLKAEGERIAKEKAAYDEKVLEEAQKVRQWDVMLIQRDKLTAEISYGQGQFEACDEEQGRAQFLSEHFGNQFSPYAAPHRLIELGSVVAGVRVIREFLPKWLEAKQAELEKLRAEIAAFAKANGIPIK